MRTYSFGGGAGWSNLKRLAMDLLCFENDMFIVDYALSHHVFQ